MATATASTVIILLLLQQHLLIIDCAVRTDATDIGPNSAWIVEPPSETIVVMRNKPYALQCHSTLSNVSYQWIYNNHTLDLVNDSRRQILPNGSLYFKYIVNKKSGDAGSYRCIVQTPNGAVSSKTVTLQTAVIHDFDESPMNVSVSSEASRSVIRFTCHVNSIPEATITWQKDKVDVPTNNERFITKVPGVLYIKKVIENDAGEYRCVAENHLLNKTKFSKFGYLSIVDTNTGSPRSISDILPLAFISPTSLYPSVKYVTEGENVIFECAATGVPSPQLNWSFTTFTGNKHTTMLSGQETSVNILSLISVSTNNSGTYTCHAFQSVTGSPDFPHAQVFRLEVVTPPIITIPPKTQTLPIVNTIRFSCGAEGNPTPNITWYHNGHRLKLHGRLKIKDKQSLVISNTVSNDSGIYQCFASNQYGTTWAGALFFIKVSPYEPAPPTNISCRTLSPTQIHVSWRNSPTNISDGPPIIIRDDSIQIAPSHSDVPSSSSSSSSDTVSTNTVNKVPKVYTIHYVLTDGGDELQYVTVDHSFTVDKLKPYKNYTFYIRVYNGKSASDPSEKVTCKTQDEAPQTVPELIVTPLSPISLNVEWSAINVNLENGAVTQYQVMWRRFQSSSNYIQVLHKNTKQFTITGLKPGGQYEVQVLGATQNGLPNIHFSWHFIELPAASSALPKPILTYGIIGQSIKLSWMVQSNKFDLFKLMYRVTSQTNQSMSVYKYNPDINHHTIHYSSDMDVYEVLLNCVSKTEEGESVSRTIAVVLDILSPPSQIEAIATSLHTVNLSWVPPDNVDASTLLFIIVYNPVSNFSQNSTTISTDLGVTSLNLSGLKPYSLYEIKISVQDKNNRKSEFSQKIQIRTLQGVPGIVEQINWKWINTITVRISWVEPVNPNGVILGYYVSYTSELHIPPTSWKQLNVSRHQNSLDLYGLSNDTQYFFMVRAATDAGFGPQSGIFSIKPLASLVKPSVYSKLPVDSPALSKEDKQLLGIVIGCVVGVCCILICAASILLKRQCVKSERVREPQHNSLGSEVAYCAQNLRPFTVDNVLHEENVPLNDVNYITRHMDGRGRYSNNISGMALPLLDQSNLRDHDITNVHIIENPQCTVDVDGYDVDSLLSESAEGGAGTEESGCSDQLAKSQKGGDSSVVDDGFHENVELNKMLVG